MVVQLTQAFNIKLLYSEAILLQVHWFLITGFIGHFVSFVAASYYLKAKV